MHLELPPIAHLGFVVKTIEKAVDAFAMLFSLKTTPVIYDFKPIRNWTDGKEVEGCYLRIALLEIQSGLRVEIIQPVSGNVEHQRFLNASEGGLHHIAYKVKDYELYKNYLLEKGGAPVFEQEAYDDVNGYRRCCYFKMSDTSAIIEVLEAARFPEKQD